MQNSGKIFLATIVGLLIFIGGVTRFHHHLDGAAEICFCCHDDDHDNHDTGTDENCPLHLDIFIVSDTQHIDTPTICCHIHCDLCAPLAYTDEPSTLKLSYTPIDTPPLDSGHTATLTRRGPPVC